MPSSLDDSGIRWDFSLVKTITFFNQKNSVSQFHHELTGSNRALAHLDDTHLTVYPNCARPACPAPSRPPPAATARQDLPRCHGHSSNRHLMTNPQSKQAQSLSVCITFRLVKALELTGN